MRSRFSLFLEACMQEYKNVRMQVRSLRIMKDENNKKALSKLFNSVDCLINDKKILIVPLLKQNGITFTKKSFEKFNELRD